MAEAAVIVTSSWAYEIETVWGGGIMPHDSGPLITQAMLGAEYHNTPLKPPFNGSGYIPSWLYFGSASVEFQLLMHACSGSSPPSNVQNDPSTASSQLSNPAPTSSDIPMNKLICNVDYIYLRQYRRFEEAEPVADLSEPFHTARINGWVLERHNRFFELTSRSKSDSPLKPKLSSIS